jgi:hypothetical protein
VPAAFFEKKRNYYNELRGGGVLMTLLCEGFMLVSCWGGWTDQKIRTPFYKEQTGLDSPSNEGVLPNRHAA